MPRLHDDQQLLSLAEAVDLGYGGYSTLRKHIVEDRLPSVRIGRRIKVRRTDLEALLVPTGSNPVDAAIDKLVAAAPPLTAEQTRRLRELIGGAVR
jgi:hypothetical protein